APGPAGRRRGDQSDAVRGGGCLAARVRGAAGAGHPALAHRRHGAGAVVLGGPVRRHDRLGQLARGGLRGGRHGGECLAAVGTAGWSGGDHAADGADIRPDRSAVAAAGGARDAIALTLGGEVVGWLGGWVVWRLFRCSTTQLPNHLTIGRTESR